MTKIGAAFSWTRRTLPWKRPSIKKKQNQKQPLVSKNLFQVVMAPVKWLQNLINAGAKEFR